MAVVCPNKSHPDWIKLEGRVGLVEAYRIYNRLDQNIPDFAFSTVEDVENYLRSIPEISFKDGIFYIKAGANQEEYNSNRVLVESKISYINKAYNNLLYIDSEPIPDELQKSKYNWGRTTADHVVISQDAFVKHYSVYNPIASAKLIDDYILPLRGNEYLYKEYNLLTNDGKIKTVEFNEKTKQWVNVLNKSPHYKFVLRQTSSGVYKIFILDETINNLSAKDEQVEKEVESNEWQNIWKDVFEESMKETNSRDIIRGLISKKYLTEDSPFFEMALQLSKVNFKVIIAKSASKDWNDLGYKGNATAFTFDNDKIVLGLKEMSESSTNFLIEVILHEIVHAYTLNEYDTNSLFHDKIKSLFLEAKSLALDKTLYGFKNPKEFMAEIFTNPSFAEAVWTSDKEEDKKARNIFQVIFDFIMRHVLNRYKEEKKTRGQEIYQKTLEELVELVVNFNKTEKEKTNFAIEDYIKDKENLVLDAYAKPEENKPKYRSGDRPSYEYSREELRKEGFTDEEIDEIRFAEPSPEEIEAKTYQKKPKNAKKEVDFENTLRHKYGVREKTTTLQTIYDNAIESLENKLKIYRGGRVGSLYKEDELKDLISQMKKYDADIVTALKLFEDFIYEQTVKIETEYNEALQKKISTNNPDAFNISQLHRWSNYISGFESIKELAEFAKGLEIGISDDPDILKIKKILDKDKLNDIVVTFEMIKKAYMKEGIPLVAKFLTPYVRRMEAEYLDKFERDYNKLSEEERRKENIDEYTKRNIGLSRSEITKLTEEVIQTQLKLAEDDINTLRRWLGSLPDSRDMIIAGMADVFMNTDIEVRHQSLELKREMLELLTALEKVSTNGTGMFGDIRDVYDYMLEKDKFGHYTGHIIDVFKSETWDERDRKLDDAAKGNASHEEIEKIKKAWAKNNTDFEFDKFDKARSVFIQELYAKGKITKKEMNKFLKADLNTKLRDILSNDEAIDEYDLWRREASRTYRKPKAKWISDQWYDLVKLATGGVLPENLDDQVQAVKENKTNDPRIAFYNFIRKNLDQHERKIPFYNRLYTRLPGVLKSRNERIKSADNTIKDVVSYTLNNTFDVMADEDMRGTEIVTNSEGKEVHFIPMYYTSDLRKKYEKEYEVFDSKRTKEIEDSYRTEYEKIPREERIRGYTISRFAKERFIKDNAIKDQSFDLSSIYFKFFTSAINYSEKKKILPAMEMLKTFIEDRDYTVTDWKGKPKVDKDGKLVIKKGDKAELPKQLESIYNVLMYGISEKDAGKLFGKIDMMKLVNAINKYTSLNLLGLNFVQGFANVALGSSMQLIESFAGRHYTVKDLYKANVYYWKHMGGILGDVGLRQPKGIVNMALEEFDIMNDYIGGEFRKNSKFRNLATSNTLMFTTHIGEHEMQTKVLFAMLNKMEAKSGDKSLGTMLDNMRVIDGKLAFEGKDGEKVTNFNQEERNKLEKECRYILSQMHGEYSKIGQPAAQQEAIGKLGLMFRKFIVPGWDRRYGTKYVNNRIGDYVEGSYVTTAKFLWDLRKDLFKFRFALMSENWNNLRSWEKANIKRTLTEVIFLLGSLFVASMLMKLRDDDDEDNWLLSFFGYQALRFRAEMWFFLNPAESMKIMRSPAAAMSVLENTIKFIDQAFHPVFSASFNFEKYERGPWKDHYKIEKTMTDFIPAYKQIYRLRDVDELISWLKQ